MKLFLPQNIFAELIAESLPAELKSEVKFLPSSLITGEVKKHGSSIGLIPTMDLLKNGELFVSGSHGISFESSLCNSYLYYASGEKDIKEISLWGDISSVEVLLAKILFKEMYDTDAGVSIITHEEKTEGKDLLVAGDKNFENDRYLKGISFAEEIIEALSLPFVNYVFASEDENTLKKFNSSAEGLGIGVYELADEGKFGSGLKAETKDYIKGNIASLIVDFESQDIDGINQLIRLPFFHGIVDDIIEVKFTNA